MFFINLWYYKTYETYILAELADNEPSGCSLVVGVNSRKWGHLGGAWDTAYALLIGWWDWSERFWYTCGLHDQQSWWWMMNVVSGNNCLRWSDVRLTIAGGPRADFSLESLFPWRYNHPCRWHKETESTEIADNILLFQRDNRGWPKNCDMQAILTDGQEIKLLQ